MSKRFVFWQTSIIIVCSVLCTATDVGAKTGLNTRSQTEQSISPPVKLVRIPRHLINNIDEVIDGIRKSRIWDDIDDFIRRIPFPQNTRNPIPKNDDFWDKVKYVFKIAVSNLKYPQRPSNVRNGQLNRILDKVYVNHNCLGILPCGIMLENFFKTNLGEPSYHSRGTEQIMRLNNLLSEGVLDPHDYNVAKDVRDDLKYAMNWP
ncbi:MAG: hypothetical protein F6K50_08240 [Moorea sp. SIO3I7]|uniref:hypothetical protein n=1 Tax=unclassified Moorena TaxID=2683338 RepID=UPI0013C1DB5A|nr:MULTISPECIES: hypothetical protein [unclassified Moorena]NEN95513.1 hypothetical protein [Moorena sp. SIO3I7]NEO06126.1 hypothetical protein [Moorena sp. SIO3I8]NEO24023.1 hypothetical protein [Moorena sp. SIO4A5]